MSDGLWLRAARDVQEELQRVDSVRGATMLRSVDFVRDALVLRTEVFQQKRDIEYWNRTHPTERPISTAFEEAVIAWLDGNGPFPVLPPEGANED